MTAAEGGVGLDIHNPDLALHKGKALRGLQGSAAPDLSLLSQPAPGQECPTKWDNSGRGRSVSEGAAPTNSARLPCLTSPLQMCLSAQERTKINAPVLEEMWQNPENGTAKL